MCFIFFFYYYIVCDEYFYGENCEILCKCGCGVQICYYIDGCVCELGWIGEICEQDVNECLISFCYGDYEFCLNIFGFYRCECKLGFNKFNE